MARLPIDGADTSVWGALLNEFLLIAHNADGTIKSVPANVGVPLTTGETTFDRKFIDAPPAPTSGDVTLTYFIASKTETITQLAMYSAGTASSGATLVRYGIYSVATNGDLALITATSNDASVFASSNTRYLKTLSSSWSKVAGNRYAVGYIVVAATTMPTVYGSTGAGNAVLDATWALEPRISGTRAGQADLPASVTAANVTANRRGPYVEMIN